MAKWTLRNPLKRVRGRTPSQSLSPGARATGGEASSSGQGEIVEQTVEDLRAELKEKDEELRQAKEEAEAVRPRNHVFACLRHGWHALKG